MSRGFFKTLSLACACAVLAAASVGYAQQQQGQQGNRQRGGPGGSQFGGGGVDIFTVLKNDKVKEDLELTPEQVAALGKLQEEGRAARGGAAGGGTPGGGQRPDQNATPEEREKFMAEFRTRMAERTKETRKKVDAALLPPQVARLSEILVQAKGTAALQEDEVKKELGITEEQTKALAKVGEDSRAKMREAFTGGGGAGGDRAAAMAKFAEMAKETEAATLAVLTADQKAKFDKMKGEKLDVDWRALAMQGFGGGRPGGDAGGTRPGGTRPARPTNNN